MPPDPSLAQEEWKKEAERSQGAEQTLTLVRRELKEVHVQMEVVRGKEEQSQMRLLKAEGRCRDLEGQVNLNPKP